MNASLELVSIVNCIQWVWKDAELRQWICDDAEYLCAPKWFVCAHWKVNGNAMSNLNLKLVDLFWYLVQKLHESDLNYTSS